MKHECKLCGHSWEAEEQQEGCPHCYAESDDIIVFTIEYRIEKLEDYLSSLEPSVMDLEKKFREFEDRLINAEGGEDDQNYVSLLERVILLEQLSEE